MKPKWKDIPDWVEYIAQDANGVWHGYNLEPYAYEDQWQRLDLNMFSGGKFIRIGRTHDCENWKHSLEQRK